MFIHHTLTALTALLTVTSSATLDPRQRHGNPRRQLVDSSSLRQRIRESALRSKAYAVQDLAYRSEGKSRVIGTPGHHDTVLWLRDQLSPLTEYYSVDLQPVELDLGKNASLSVNGRSVQAWAVALAPAGSASGRLVRVPNLGCEEADYQEDLTGAVALIFRGTCEFGQKVRLAASHGAVGVIAYNNVPGTLEGYSLQLLPDPAKPYVPTGGITQADGEALIAQLEAGTTINIELTTETKFVMTYNVIAETRSGDPNNVIHIGAHSDSVAEGPGMNDNASGTISILEVAIQLTNFRVNNAVRFSWWTAEEQGLLGATYYVSQLSQAEKDKIRLHLNFDMLASPNFAIQIYDGDGSAFNLTGPPGSAEAEKEFARYFDRIARLNHTETEFDGRSDYGPFLEAGIPAGGLFAGAEGIKTVEELAMFGGAAGVPYDVNYHEDGDTVNNMNFGCWMQMTRAIAHMTATYARSFESIPRRNTTATRKRAEGWARIEQTAAYRRRV